MPVVLSQVGSPPGTIVAYASQIPPQGWLLCNGQEIDRLQYKDLYMVIKGTFGSPSTTTFCVPNLCGRMIIGSGTGGAPLTNRVVGATGGAESCKLSVTHLPSHTHTATSNKTGSHNHDGATQSSNATHKHYIPNLFGGNEFWAEGDGAGGQCRPAYEPVPGDKDTYDANAPHTHNITSGGEHSHTITVDSTGDGTAVNIMNPFFVCSFIIKA
jgi:microcystin-dependent protein